MGSSPNVLIDKSKLIVKGLYYEDCPYFNPNLYYSQFKVKILFDPSTGDTKWLNKERHPFSGLEMTVGPFKIGSCWRGTSFWCKDCWNTKAELCLNKHTGKSEATDISAAHKLIIEWNNGLDTKGSKQRLIIRNFISSLLP